MIPEAREVRLSRKDRKVLEASCRSPVTLQRDLKRARIVLLAAAGRSTQSIAREVLQSKGGTTIAAIVRVTGWQPHSVRGFLAGVVRKRLKLQLASRKVNDNRIYQITSEDSTKVSTR